MLHYISTTPCAQLQALNRCFSTMHKLQQCLVTSMQLSHCQPLGRLARVSDNAGAMNDWLMHTGVTTKIPSLIGFSHQPCSQSTKSDPLGAQNELQKYRLSEFLVDSEGDSGISPSSKVPRRVRSIWAHFRFSQFMPMDLEIMPTVLDIS